MLYVKIMSAEDMDDTCQCKNYTIVPIQNSEVMRFCENAEGQGPDTPKYMLEVHHPDGTHEGHPLTGNAYVMNEAGKTIASHSS